MKLALALVLAASVAHADPESDADAAFRAAQARAAAGDAGAIDAFEQLGAARPSTRWTDNAWLEAGRLAEHAGDYARARRDLEQAVATANDELSAKRARGELAIVERAAGAGGEWSAVAAQHDRLEQQMFAGGDPKPAARELEALIASNPGYPRAALAMLLVAHAREGEGDAGAALAWLEKAQAVAAPVDRVFVRAELVRTLIRAGELTRARDEIARLEIPGSPDLPREARGADARPVAAELRRELARAEPRRWLRYTLWGVLAVLAFASAVALLRAAGSWRAAVRRLVRPPTEVYFLVPIAAVLVIVAATGNPLVARAVRVIAIAGVAVTWISGSILDAVRARGRVRFARAAIHAVLAVTAVAAATYLAVDRDRMIDLVIETWRSGPQMR